MTKQSTRPGSRPWTAAMWLVAGVALTACQSTGTRETETDSATGAFEFALVGDNPYSEQNETRYEDLINDINERNLAWVLHVGDLKGGGQSCSDEMLTSRFRLNQRFAPALVFTPGDNDWYDCVRPSAGEYDAYERLAFLRSLFFPDPTSTTGGRPMPVQPQSAHDPAHAEFVENVLWVKGQIVFATVHLVGPSQAPTEQDEARMDAAIAWIEHAFERARQIDARGVFLATQVDPWVFSGLPALMNAYCPVCPQRRPGLDRLYDALTEAARGIQVPVVLAVGDTHVFRIDKPLYDASGELVENFTRIEVFGDPYVHWVRVSVNPEDPAVFGFHEEIVEERLEGEEPLDAQFLGRQGSGN